ncbi:MAG: type I methionyl aminopeptidase [Candidatus Omnitrophota bacterium]
MIPLKSERDLEMMRASGRILGRVMQQLRQCIKAGISTVELDRLAGELILKEGGLPAFKGYKGFPANICVSVNEEVVHGIPSARKLAEGDIVSVDMGVNYEGYFSDAAITVGVGRIHPDLKKLIEVSRTALSEGVKQARIDNRIRDISQAIQGCVEKNGFSVVRQFVGHGIGINLHEEPEIPNFVNPRQNQPLKSGMVLAIEPMVNLGEWECEIMENGWTAVTRDGLPSAHFEETVAVTENGPEILTPIDG